MFRFGDKRIFIRDPRLLEIYTGLLSIAYGILYWYYSILESNAVFSVALEVYGSSRNAAIIGIGSGIIQVIFTTLYAYHRKPYQIQIRIIATFAEMYFWSVLVYNFYILPGFYVATTNYSFAVCANIFVAVVLIIRGQNIE